MLHHGVAKGGEKEEGERQKLVRNTKTAGTATRE